MRIACLQFAPQVGDVNNNLNRADAVLSKANPNDLDLLVLPELAFAGYNFKSLSEISPFLEPTGAGITSLWARTAALKHNCIVAAGYPEKADVSRNWPTSPEYYNSVIIVDREGDTIGNYRKSHLYYTDETWALEGPNGFFEGYIPSVGKVAMGICMDLNPYRFEAPWSAFEFACHALQVAANVVILSMAWLTREDARHFSRMPREPDMETLTYWVKRLEPLIRSENDDEIIVIFANRAGQEDDAVYAGTSAVIGVQHGEVSVYGLLGRGEKELLVVDTSLPPFAKLVYRPESELNHVGESSIPTEMIVLAASESLNPEPPVSAISSNTTDPDVANSRSHVHADDVENASRESARCGSADRVMITHDTALKPMTGATTTTPFKEPRVSPRYFGVQPTMNTGIQNPSQGPLTSTKTQLRAMSPSTEIALAVENTSEGNAPRHSKSSSKLKDDMSTMRQAILEQSKSESPPARPSSLRIESASRDCYGDRSESVISIRPSSMTGHRAQGKRSDETVVAQERGVPGISDGSRYCCEGQTWQAISLPSEVRRIQSGDRGASKHPTSLDLDHSRVNRTSSHQSSLRSAIVDIGGVQNHSVSIDMDKVGADLLVFEERNGQPKRDSLVCHADEDDFVVFHASARRDHQSTGRPNDSQEVERPSPRKGRTPSSISSPSHSRMKSPAHVVSPTAGRASSKPQHSPSSKSLRLVDGGRQWIEQWAQTTQSPKGSSHAPTSPLSLPEPPVVSKAASGVNMVKAVSRGPVEALNGSRPNSGDRSPWTTSPTVLPGKIGTPSSREMSLTSTTGSSVYSSSLHRVEISSATTAPESVPLTPKAMVLAPGWDEATTLTAPVIKTVIPQ